MKGKWIMDNIKWRIKFIFLIFAFYLLLSTYYQSANAQTGSCGSGSPARASGLVTTKDLSGKFTTSTGTCIVSDKTTFIPFKIPTYDDLKSTFFDQSKNPRKTTISGSANQGDLTSNLSPSDTNRLFFIDGNLNINGNVFSGRDAPVVVFVKGNLLISSNITYASSSSKAGLVFVVGGDTNIDQSVTEINAVIISSGTIYTAGNSCSPSSINTSALTVKGSLIALNINNWIHFCRNLNNNSTPAEIIQVQPKYLAIFKDIFSETLQKWSEVTADTTIIGGEAGPSPGPGGGSQNSVPTNDLISYWKLEETSGSRYDSNSFNTLSDNNGAGYTNGVLNNALLLRASNRQYLSIPSNDSLSLGSDTSFTITAWVYMNSKPTADRTGIVSKWDNGSNANVEYSLQYKGNNGTDRFQLVAGNRSSSAEAVANSFGSPATGTWYFIAAWHDGTANTLNIQVNNGPVDSVPWTGGTYNGSTIFSIGSSSGANNTYFDGAIDEVGFWKRVLTDNERSAIYNNSLGGSFIPPQTSCPNSNLSSYYRMSETSGSTLSDSVGSVNGTAFGTTITPGKLGYARQFNGNGDYVAIGDSSKFNFGNRDFAFGGWFVTNDVSQYKVLIMNGENNGGATARFFNRINQSTGDLTSSLADGRNEVNLNCPNVNLSDGRWHFIMTVVDRGGNEMRNYVDSALVCSTNISVLGPINPNFGLRLGINGARPEQYFKGTMDEISIWDRAIGSQDINTLYNQGRGTTCP